MRERASRARPSSSASATTFAMPTDEPSRAGLTNTGMPSPASSARTASGSARQRCSRTRRVGDLRHAGGRHHLLEHDLVHAQRRRQHARADVRHVEQLEQPLDRAVLAERAVQDREHGVGVEQPAAGRQRQRLAVVHPAPVALDRRPPAPRGRLAPAASRTNAAELSETSCSDERPPPRTATLTGRRRRSGLGVGRAPSRTARPTIRTREPSRALLGPLGRCSSTTPSSVVVGHRLVAHAHLEAGVLEHAARLVLGLVDHVGHLDVRRRLRDHELDRGALRDRLPAAGLCSSTVPGSSSAVSSSVDLADAQPGRLDARCARSPRSGRSRPAPRPARAARDAQRHGAPALDQAALRRRGVDHAALRPRRRRRPARPSARSPPRAAGPRRSSRGEPRDVGHGRLARPGGDGDRHGRALLGLRARPRVLRRHLVARDVGVRDALDVRPRSRGSAGSARRSPRRGRSRSAPSAARA